MRNTLIFHWKKETFHQLRLFSQTHKSFCVRTKQMANYLCFDSKDCNISDSWLMEASNIFSVYSQINVIYAMYSFAGNSSSEHNNVANVIFKMELCRCLHAYTYGAIHLAGIIMSCVSIDAKQKHRTFSCAVLNTHRFLCLNKHCDVDFSNENSVK